MDVAALPSRFAEADRRIPRSWNELRGPADVAARLGAAYELAGYQVSHVESTSRMARLEVGDGNQSCEIDLLKEAIGPVLTLDDAVGLKVRALHDRAAHRDFIDVHAAAIRGGYTYADLERVVVTHTPHFATADLADR